MSKSHNLWVAMFKQCSTGLKRKKITWIEKISIWHQRHNLQEKKETIWQKLQTLENWFCQERNKATLLHQYNPSILTNLIPLYTKWHMICLKGNAARPINKQKKDELKNFLTNLRLKITKKYFQEDWKVKKLLVKVYCYYPLVVQFCSCMGWTLY